MNGESTSPEATQSNGTSKKQEKSGNTVQKGSGKYKHTFAVHAESRASCLSHDSPVAPSFSGFRNLMGLVLVASNLRLMIENFTKYGILVTLSGSKVASKDWMFFWLLYLLVPCHLFIAYSIELLAAEYAKEKVGERKKSERRKDYDQAEKQKKSLFSTWRVIAFAHGFNATIMLAYATYMVYSWMHNPGLAMAAELHAVIVWLKVCSYAFTNRDLRHAYVNADRNDPPLPPLYKTCLYPKNITIKNLCYFWWAPTLIYQPVYPRTNKIRWDFVARRAAEAFLLTIVIWVACAQYAVPLLQNSLSEISDLNWINIVERTLKLSTISLVCWLAGFFALFQSFLNLLAELLYFGDREFYSDWWNSASLRTYWTSWNKPVTNFMKRHIYTPMVGRGVPPVLAQLITFLFSGVLHELLVGVPTHNILGVAFLGMVGQIPLIMITEPLSKMKGHNAKLAGNLIFWVTFCFFGQPVAALAYFFAWQARYGADSRPEWPHAF
ncbi:diacylglycerol o-acyltransferase 1c [Acrodontium crateriforme]|uniref:O-acyltransferase n=1 Tax=Acrodontium crateriforme TaxID=150365 RepID=A0AAQ3M7X5_9PEZI|nr:diacylglycerol o-acyltransferase 1c [Acrodontium crateriforme]